MALSKSDAVKNAQLAVYVSQAGSNPVIQFLSGPVPATVGTALVGSNLVLGTSACSMTLAPAATGGVLTANPIGDATGTAAATASGTIATFARLCTSALVPVFQVTVGGSGSGAEIIMTPDATIKTDQPIQWTILTITAGN